jgi:hypothetical protein
MNAMVEVIDYKFVLACIAIFISSLNMVYYVIAVFKGKTKPHIFTWLIWGLITGIVGLVQLLNGGGYGAYFTLWVSFVSFVRVFIAIPYGEKNITLSDKIALLFCLLSVVLWQLTDNPMLSILIVTLIDVVAFYPTLRKSYLKPHEENLISFVLMTFTMSIGFFALETYSVLTLFYPVTIVSCLLFSSLFLIVRRSQLGYKVFTT